MTTLSGVIQRGVRGSQPAAAAVPIGTLYCVTDESSIVERSTGAAWQSYSPTGGIAVTLLDAKGDLIAASAADTAAKLTVGTNDYGLVAASGETTGLKWTRPQVYAGNANPGTPATGEQFFRTDLGLLIYYNGTRWLTVQQYVIELKPFSNTFATTMSVTTASRMLGWKPSVIATDFWMETALVIGTVLTTNNGTHYWTYDFASDSAAGGSPTTITQISSAAWTAGQNSQAEATVNALLGTTEVYIGLNCTKVSSPGNCYAYDAKVVGRLVIT